MISEHKHKIRTQGYEGFTLMEVMVTTFIVVVSLLGVMRLYIYSSSLSDEAGSLTVVMSQAHDKIEEIRDASYDDITTDYASGGTPGNTFDLDGFTGKGAVYLDATNADLIEVKVVISWITPDGRVHGEDTDMDGVLDAGEDSDSDGALSSMATLITKVARM